MSSGPSISGDLLKWRANREICCTYESCVCGERFLTCMSSVMRRRSDVMESSFALVGFAANSFSTRSREVTLGTSRYQIPRSGLVQFFLCEALHKRKNWIHVGSEQAG